MKSWHSHVHKTRRNPNCSIYLLPKQNAIETIRTNDPIGVCAKQLMSECQEFDFGLDHSFRYASDLECGIEKLKSGASLHCWNSFFDCMFPSESSSVSITRKCDVIFQIIFNLIHNGQRKTPSHTAISQSIHETCKSKTLIQIFKRLGLAISYDHVKRIDIGIGQGSFAAVLKFQQIFSQIYHQI